MKRLGEDHWWQWADKEEQQKKEPRDHVENMESGFEWICGPWGVARGWTGRGRLGPQTTTWISKGEKAVFKNLEKDPKFISSLSQRIEGISSQYHPGSMWRNRPGRLWSGPVW